MHIEAMSVEMDEPQPIEPIDVGLRHIDGFAAVGRKRGIAALCQPARHVRGIAQGIDHHCVVVSLQGDQAERLADACEQPVDHALAVRSLVDVIAERDDDARLADRPRGNLIETVTEQIKPAVNIRNDEGLAHQLNSLSRLVIGRLERRDGLQRDLCSLARQRGEVGINLLVAYEATMIQRIFLGVRSAGPIFISLRHYRQRRSGPRFPVLIWSILPRVRSLGIAFAQAYPNRLLLVVHRGGERRSDWKRASRGGLTVMAAPRTPLSRRWVESAESLLERCCLFRSASKRPAATARSEVNHPPTD